MIVKKGDYSVVPEKNKGQEEEGPVDGRDNDGGEPDFSDDAKKMKEIPKATGKDGGIKTFREFDGEGQKTKDKAKEVKEIGRAHV